MSAVLKLVQGSPEWHAYRQDMRNASETPAVLGISPWVTPYQLWLLKTGRSDAGGQHRRCSTARRWSRRPGRLRGADRPGHASRWCCRTGCTRPAWTASTLAGDLIVEIKCPFRGKASALWQSAEEGEVPGHYNAQVQHQLMVSGASAGALLGAIRRAGRR